VRKLVIGPGKLSFVVTHGKEIVASLVEFMNRISMVWCPFVSGKSL
jgi:hypothetical protein